MFTKYAWAITLMNISGITKTNAFKAILQEGRKPEELWVDLSSLLYNIHTNLLQYFFVHYQRSRF